MGFLAEALTFDLKQTFVDFLHIAIGACGFVLITKQISGSTAESEARIIAGLLSGIGFIGSSAILK